MSTICSAFGCLGKYKIFGTLRNALDDDLGHVDNLLGNRRQRVKGSTSTSCSIISGTGTSSVGNPGTASTIWSTLCR